MAQQDHHPKFEIIPLTEEEQHQYESLILEIAVLYKKWQEHEATLRTRLQDKAGKGRDWELDKSKKFLVLSGHIKE